MLDDLYAEKNTEDELHPHTDLDVLRKLILQTYETRRLVLLSTNFTMDGVLERISELDPIGRISSRIAEMHMQAIELTGEDYRRQIAQSRRDERQDPFAL